VSVKIDTNWQRYTNGNTLPEGTKVVVETGTFPTSCVKQGDVFVPQGCGREGYAARWPMSSKFLPADMSEDHLFTRCDIVARYA